MAKKYQKPEPTGRGYVDAAILLLRAIDSLYKMIE